MIAISNRWTSMQRLVPHSFHFLIIKRRRKRTRRRRRIKRRFDQRWRWPLLCLLVSFLLFYCFIWFDIIYVYTYNIYICWVLYLSVATAQCPPAPFSDQYSEFIPPETKNQIKSWCGWGWSAAFKGQGGATPSEEQEKKATQNENKNIYNTYTHTDRTESDRIHGDIIELCRSGSSAIWLWRR